MLPVLRASNPIKSQTKKWCEAHKGQVEIALPDGTRCDCVTDIREAGQEPLYDQEEAEEYIFMNPVKRERLARGWTQRDLADHLEVKQSTVAKWERKEAVYRKKTRQKLARIFGVNEETFL